MFLSTNTCEGIGDCIKKCPTKAIKLIGGKAFSCLTCGACYKSCPNDAIFINNYGGYVVDKTKCNACGICMYNCPTNNISIIDGIVYGICSRCGVCVDACPTHSRIDGFEANEEKQMDFIKSLNVSLPTYEKPVKSSKKEVTKGYFGTNLDNCIFCGRCEDYCPTEAINVKNERGEGICTECRLCVDACPNGSINRQLIVNNKTCTLCLSCVDACPHDAISVGDFEVNINKIHTEQAGTIVSCVNCGLCAETSENGSMIRIDEKQRYDPTKDVVDVERSHKKSIEVCPVSTLKESREMIVFDESTGKEHPTLKGFCVSCGLCVQVCDVAHAREFKVDTWDGSISDDCISCGTCVNICPHEAISLNRGDISVDLDKCILCSKCSIYCPVDAIPRTTLDKKIIAKGFNTIDQRTCIHCGLCYENCHYEAIEKVEDGFEVNEERCTYCSGCVNVCPSNSFIFERKFKDSTEGI